MIVWPVFDIHNRYVNNFNLQLETFRVSEPHMKRKAGKLIGSSRANSERPTTPNDVATEATQAGDSEPPDSTASIDSDAPVRDPKFDRFDRAPFASRIAETLARRIDPASLVIAIYGAWGDGKTTVLNFIREALQSESSVVCVNFNPWRLNGEDELLTGFFSTLADALDAELKSTTEKIGELLKRYSFFLKPIPVVGKLDDVAQGAGSLMSAVSIDKLRSEISSILRSSRKRVVVMIDDIDRLEKSEIQAIFRLVKLTADFDYVAYVLAFDEAMVAAAIGERFSSNVEKSVIAGTNFLEKIVQVGLHLPPAGVEELQTYAFEQIDEALRISGVRLPQEDLIEFVLNFRGGIAPHLRTPRMAKKYGNALQFALGILRDEIRYIDLMLLEGIRTFYPQLYLALRDRKTLLLKGEKGFDVSVFIRENLPTSTNEEVTGLTRIIRGLFPRTGNSIHPADWDLQWSKQQRVCATHYFDRYFSYAIRANDVSDYALDQLLNLESVDDKGYLESLRSLLYPKNAHVFISKLRDREKELSPNAARRISIALAAISKSLPTSTSVLDAMSRPLVQAAAFASRALSCVPEVERLDLAKQVIEASENPMFIPACILMMSTGNEGEPRILTPEQEAEMRRFGAETLVGKLEQLGEPFVQVATEDISNVMNAVQWGLGHESARQYATKWVEVQPRSAARLIRAYKGKGMSLETGLPVESPFFRQMYDGIVALVDADTLIRALTAVYGDALQEALELSKEDDDLRLSKQFVSMSAKIAQTKNTDEANGKGSS